MWTMRKLLARVGLLASAAALLPLTTATLAQADPGAQEYHWCNGPVVVAPGISETTCVNAVFTNSSERFYNASVKVRNTSPNSVTSRPDLLVGSTTYFGPYQTIEPGAEKFNVTNEILDPPPVQLTGRAYLQSVNWWTYTYSP
jgi:hypothetical protein